jgi:uncharacterized membrane protein
MAPKKKQSKKKKARIALEAAALRATTWIGSIKSLIVHSALFVSAFLIPILGIASFERVLLVLTTLLSLEAIYLAIFIQMSVNKNSADIEEIQEDIEGIEEDIEEIGEDVEEIQKDVDEIQTDVDEIQEDIEEIEEEHERDNKEDEKIEKKEFEALAAIQDILTKLQKEIEQLKK